MNKIQKYEYVRKMDDSQFEFLKDMFKRSKTAMCENIAKAIDILAAAGLVYVAYDAVDTIPTILASIGAVQLLLKKRLIAFVSGLIGAINYTKDMDVAKDAAISANNMVADIKNYNIENLVKKYNDADTESK